jgi:SAM-dependent methyltransferase
MIKTLTKIYLQQSFNPGLLGIFINPFYFIRKGLYNGIRRNAHVLTGKLLDFGCGSKPYKELFRVNEYIGLDIAVSGHSHEKEVIDIYYDGKKIPCENNSFDSVFSSEVFEHVFNLEEVLIEINRVLKPGGKALFAVPFVWDEHEIPYDFGRYSSFGIRHLLEKNGYVVEKIETDTHFVQVVFQLWNLYLHNIVRTKNKYLNLLLYSIFISPFTIIGIITSFLLPKNKGLYHNNIIIAKKVA